MEIHCCHGHEGPNGGLTPSRTRSSPQSVHLPSVFHRGWGVAHQMVFSLLWLFDLAPSMVFKGLTSRVIDFLVNDFTKVHMTRCKRRTERCVRGPPPSGYCTRRAPRTSSNFSPTNFNLRVLCNMVTPVSLVPVCPPYSMYLVLGRSR